MKIKSSKGTTLNLTALLVTLTVLSISLISAVGVSTPYWSTNPLKLQPGQTTIVELGLQNMVGDHNVTLRANLTKGNSIATITDENQDYFIPLGSDDVKVSLEVSLPANAAIDGVTEIEISFVEVSPESEGGFFTVASAFTQRIPVVVVNEPTESVLYGQKQEISNGTWTILAFVVLVVIALAVMINKRRG